MEKFYSRFSAMLCIFTLVLTHVMMAQNKAAIQPNFSNPFAQKQTRGSFKTIRPAAPALANQSRDKKSFTLQQEGDYSIIHFTNISLIKASDFFQTFSNDLKISQADNFKLLKSEIDNMGFTHYRYQHTYSGINVIGSEYLLHEKDGKLVSANGKLYTRLSINTVPTVSKEIAIKKAIRFVGSKKYQWENQVSESLLKKESNDVNATYYPQAELVIAPIDGKYKRENFRLCYKINIASEKPYDIVDVYVDANTGEIINKISKINSSDVTGNASTLYSGTKNITMDSYNGHYRLRESGRPVQTYNMNYGTDYTSAVDFTNTTTTWAPVPKLNSLTISAVASSWWYTALADISPDLFIVIKDGTSNIVYTSGYFDNTPPPLIFGNLNISMVNPPYTAEIWDYDAVGGNDFGGSYSIGASAGTINWSGSGNNGTFTNTIEANPALDVHWAMEKTYDFYLTQLGRNSFDNLGGVIKNYIHKDIAWDNANWNGTAMSYGDGDGTLLSPLMSIDVVGHEFSHAVVQYTAGLQYQDESGALNESFADIFGTAIEFYGATNPNWTMGENIVLVSPYYMRSMSNPNSAPVQFGQQPDTYSGTYWYSGTGDNGGVHTNSGVQNFWYYLLSQGGSGTNDIGNAFSVTGIGITQATQIAYRNLSYYLTSSSDYMASYYGSLQAAEDLYGANSTQQNAVRAAWFAVGIGNTSTGQCSGTTLFSSTSDSFTDGSGSSNYQDNLDCSWLIEPTGANTITLNFPTFDTENGYDSVMVYDGETTSDPLLMVWWGNTLPPTINSSNGALLVRFISDINTNTTGWTANYTSNGMSYCDGGTILSGATGSFSDGSSTNNYGNNQFCYWTIAPPCATNVTLSFSSFDTESGYDGVIVYDGNNTSAPILLNTSGNTIPSNLTSTGGEMLVLFISDYSTTMQGFSANYTSTGTPYCSGTTNLNTSDYGNIDDGSGLNNYCNNMNCSWLIQPPQATSVTFNFNSFDVEPTSTDGFSVYDAVEIYDGINSSATLLGKFSGNTLPPSITSTGGSMYIHFYSDVSEVRQGWDGYYTSTQVSYCNGTTNLTAPSGVFSDGSNANLYSNNSDCQWLIQPSSASSITLTFSSFDTEAGYDGVIVYDGNNTSATQLGNFSGNSIPSAVTSTGGSMLVRFLSDVALRQNGWTANYSSTTSALAAVTISQTIGSNPICAGTPVTFTASPSNGGTAPSYQWEINGIPTGSNSPTFSSNLLTNNQIVTCIMTSNLVGVIGNPASSNSIAMAVNALPSVPIVTVVNNCGNSVLTTAAVGALLWSNNTTTPSITVTNAGNYSVTVTDGNNCFSTSLSTAVSIDSIPTTPTISQNGMLLTSSSTNGNQWYLNGSAIAGATSQTYTVLQIGNYTVNVTYNGCTSPISAQINIINTGILEGINSDLLTIYPNPNNGQFTISFNSALKSNYKIKLVNALGQLIYEEKLSDFIGTYSKQLSLIDYGKGVYTIILTNGKKEVVQKLVVY